MVARDTLLFYLSKNTISVWIGIFRAIVHYLMVIFDFAEYLEIGCRKRWFGKSNCIKLFVQTMILMFFESHFVSKEEKL